MKLKLLLILTIPLLFVNATIASASNTTLKAGTGGPTGNYFSMGTDINSYCSDSLVEPPATLEIIQTDGSITNLMGMGDKRFSIGWVQEDVLHYFAKQTPRKVNQQRLKIIVGGHQEDLHILIPRGWQPVGQSISWREKLANLVSSKPPEGVSLDSLRGQTISSWGGSLISTKALSLFTDLNLNPVEIKNGETPKTPIILVGGQPYKPVQDYLAKGYTLLPINSESVTSKAPFYVKSTLNYEVGGKIISMPSFGVRALFVGKAFRNASRNKSMEALAKCITENLYDLADDPNTNPLWSSVVELEAEGPTSWSYFNLQ